MVAVQMKHHIKSKLNRRSVKNILATNVIRPIYYHSSNTVEAESYQQMSGGSATKLVTYVVLFTNKWYVYSRHSFLLLLLGVTAFETSPLRIYFSIYQEPLQHPSIVSGFYLSYIISNAILPS